MCFDLDEIATWSSFLSIRKKQEGGPPISGRNPEFQFFVQEGGMIPSLCQDEYYLRKGDSFLARCERRIVDCTSKKRDFLSSKEATRILRAGGKKDTASTRESFFFKYPA